MPGRQLGWLVPTAERIAGLRYAGPSARRLLVETTPAERVDLASKVRILDQGYLGSCVANMAAQVIRVAMLTAGAPATTDFLSRLWCYSLALAADGHWGQDVGTYNATAFDQLARYGFPKERFWAYDQGVFGQRPPLLAWQRARDQRQTGSVAYSQITDGDWLRLDTIDRALTAGMAVGFGTQVTREFCDSSPTDVVDRPRAGAALAGGHALTVVGREPDPVHRVRYKIANSWGTGWGESGFCWMSAAYLTWAMTADLWIVPRAPRFSGAAWEDEA